MRERKIGNTSLPEIGFGCMNLSHAYGVPPPEEDAIRLLHRAFDLGVRHFDTAALYGFGKNESLLGRGLKSIRKDIFLASKCGMTGVDGKRVIDGRPEVLLKTVDEALTRLQTDHIDLYYLHRWDRQVPVEESVGAMSRMVEAGKVGMLGLSEVSAETLRRAHAEHPIAAVQTEYSLWSRNAEVAILDACKALGTAFVAFSPVARGFLCGGVRNVDQLAEKDIRRGMPRFQEPNFSTNAGLLGAYEALAREAGCTMAQLSLAWLLSQAEHIHPIPGTTSSEHLAENVATAHLNIPPDILARAGQLINAETVAGPRYPEPTQKEIDTEELSD